MKRWIVAIAGLVCVVGPGALYSFSLLSNPLTAAFGWNSGDVAWAFAIANFFLAVGGVIGGALSDRFGSRFVAAGGIALWAGGNLLCATLGQSHSLLAFYAFYGVIGGTGCGIAYVSALSSVLKWFPRTRGFGGGFVIMGFGLGSFAYNSVVKSSGAFATIAADTQTYVAAHASALAQHVPFESAKYLMAPGSVSALMSLFSFSAVAFAIVGIIAALLLSNPPAPEMALAEAAQPQFTTGRMVADPRFYVLWAMLFLNIFGGITVIANMVAILREASDMSAASAAGLYGFLALFNGVGRVALGTLSDKISRRVVFAIIFGGQAIAFFALDATKDPTLLATAIGVLLLCYGGGFGVMPALNADFFGTKHFGLNYGVLLSAWGLAAVFGTFFISAMRSIGGSFIGLMQPVSIVLLVAMFFPLIIESVKRSDPRDAKPLTIPS